MLTGAALFSGFYLNELLMKLLARHDPHPHLFDAYALTLGALDPQSETSVESALRAFELTLLREVGVLPDLSLVTLTQEHVDAASPYALLPEAGVAAPRAEQARLPGGVLLALQAALMHGSLPALRAGLCVGTARTQERLARIASLSSGHRPASNAPGAADPADVVLKRF